MPSPTSALSTLRLDLAESFMEFELEAQRRGFIADRVLPVVEVMKQAGNFGKIPIEQLLQQRDTARSPGSGYARGKFTFGKATYTCEEHGAEEAIDDREAAMYRDYFDAEQISTQRALDVVLRNAEIRAAALIFNATTWTSNTTAVTNEWDDLVNAVPLTDVEAAVQAVWAASGLWPNVMIIDRKVFRNLRNCEQIIDRIKYAGIMDPAAGNITAAAMAQVFDLDEIIIAGSPKTTAIEGQDTVIAGIWDDEYAMLCRVATSQDMREPCIGRTFHWGDDGSALRGTFETYREEKVRSDIVRVRHDVDELVLYVEAGHLLSNITS